MTLFKIAPYSKLVKVGDASYILYNSYMGALARIGSSLFQLISPYLNGDEFNLEHLCDNRVAELCDQGFFVPKHIQKDDIEKNLDREREETSLNLIILPHEGCNFKCTYCYETFSGAKMKPSTVSGLKRFVSSGIDKYKMLKVYWFGGEPLLGKNMIFDLSSSFISSCEDIAIYEASMTTNGYLLSPETATTLIKLGVRNFQVTLDGPQAVHNKNRPLKNHGPTYGRIMRNLLYMKSLDMEFSVAIRVNFSENSLSSILGWANDDLGSLIENDGRFCLNFNMIENWKSINSKCAAEPSTSSSFSLKLDIIEQLNSGIIPIKFIKEILSPHGNVCYASKKSSLIVGADGRVYKCTIAFNDPVNSIGYLDEYGVLEIDLDKFNLWTQTDHLDCSACTTCFLYPSCQSRKCPLFGIKQKKPKCPMSWDDYVRLIEVMAQNPNTFKQEEMSC